MRRLAFDEPPVKGDEQPEQIRVRGCWRRAEDIVDHWRESGCWWAGEGPRDFFLVETGQQVFVVCKDQAGWKLERRID